MQSPIDIRTFYYALVCYFVQVLSKVVSKNIIPKFLYNFGEIIRTCNVQINNTDKVNCIYGFTVKREELDDSLTLQGTQLLNYVTVNLENSHTRR